MSEKANLTTREASEHIGVPTRTLESWRLKQVGPPWLKMCGLVRYKRSALDKWLAANERLPT